MLAERVAITSGSGPCSGAEDAILPSFGLVPFRGPVAKFVHTYFRGDASVGSRCGSRPAEIRSPRVRKTGNRLVPRWEAYTQEKIGGIPASPGKGIAVGGQGNRGMTLTETNGSHSLHSSRRQRILLPLPAIESAVCSCDRSRPPMAAAGQSGSLRRLLPMLSPPHGRRDPERKPWKTRALETAEVPLLALPPSNGDGKGPGEWIR